MKPTLALSMIVKNEEKDLPGCLESVRGIVDEIVIADTGSTDGTIAVAESFGAKVIRIPWNDDFAEARNASLREVTTDWVLSLDADEQLDSHAGPEIASTLLRQNIVGYLVPIRNYVHDVNKTLWDKTFRPNDSRLPSASQFPGFLEHENFRLFRNQPEIYFERRVHETAGDRVQATGIMATAKFVIHHLGFVVSYEEWLYKNEFYLHLGQRKVEELPNNGQAFFELGLMEFDYKANPEAALQLFVRACELKPRQGVFWFFQGQALIRLQRPLEAIPLLQRARQLGGINIPACLEAEGDAHFACSQFAEARRVYRTMLDSGETPEILSKLGLTELRLGHSEAGLKKLCRAASRGSSASIYDRLIAGLASSGRVADAARAAEEKLEAVGHSPSAFLRASVLWAHVKNDEKALEIANKGIKEFPESAELRSICAELSRPLMVGTIIEKNSTEVKDFGGCPR